LTAGLLARGSLPCAAFPVTQWHSGAWLSAYSCGGSRGFRHPHEPGVLTAFPFDPGREPSTDTVSARMTMVNVRRKSAGEFSCGPAPRHRQGKPPTEQLGSLARAPPATAACFRLPPYRPGGCCSQPLAPIEHARFGDLPSGHLGRVRLT